MQQQMENLLSELTGLWRFRWVGLALAWTIALVGWTAIATLPNTYEAKARVYVDATSVLKPLLQGLAVETNVDAQLNYVRQALLSRPQLEKVAAKTDLGNRAKTPDERGELIDTFFKNITIEASGDSRFQDKLFTITYRDHDPRLAYAVVNTLLNAFVEDSLGAGRQSTATAQKFLREQIAEYEHRLGEAETRLADFKRKNLGLMPGEQGDYFSRVQQEAEAIKKAQAALTVLESRRGTLSGQLRGESPFAPGAAGAAGGASAGTGTDTGIQLKQVRARLAELMLKYTDKHPEVVELRETVAQLEERQREEVAALQRGDATAAAVAGLSANPVYQSIQMQLNQVNVEISALRGEVADRQRRVTELQRMQNLAPEVEAELARLNRDYGVTKSQYESMVERLEKARVSEQASETGTIKFEVIDPPVMPTAPVAPKRALLASAVLVVALLAGLAIAWLLHMLKPVVTSARKLSKATGIPVLGVVSRAWQADGRERERRQLLWFSTAAGALVVGFGIALLQGPNASALARLIG